jgi:OmpA-OmpF porin, OOP family
VASVRVLVTNMQGKARSGETILFVDQDRKRTFSGVSDRRGEFTLDLPAGAVYQIRIKGVGDEQEYSTVALPALKPGEYYDGEIVVTVRFEPPRTFLLNNVYFDTGKSTLRSASYKELNELVEFMKLKPTLTIEIGGHTDSVGDDETNLRLSQSRAEAVKAYLVSKDISPSRVVAKGYGESKPVASNNTPEGRQQNRRTEVTIISE